ncbi:MAG: amidohydrolase family protein [Rhodospirillales bacterium]
MADLLIRGALLHDGSGAPAARGDLAIEGGRIAAIGPDLKIDAREVIDADGLALMPGIIDSHTHYDAQITWDPYLNPSPALGVTTCIIGNCGFTIAPNRPEHRDLFMRNLTQVEGMSLEALRTGIDWSFRSFPEYLDRIEARGVTPNVAAFIGHSALRTWAMGEDATERAATPGEIETMAAVVREAMRAGAVGFATSTAPQHNGDGGKPMPSRLADDDELIGLARAMGADGKGVFMLTRGGQTTIPWLEKLSVAAGKRPVMIAALLHSPNKPTATFEALDDIAAAQSRGVPLYGQVSPCPLTFEFTFRSPYPFESINAWKPAMTAPKDRVGEILADPSFRQSVRDELATINPIRLFNGDWSKVGIIQCARDENAHLEHATIADRAAEAGVDPLDWALDLALSEDLETLFYAHVLNSDEDAVGKMMNHPHASIALSDAGAHLSFFCDAGYGLYLLGHWSRDLGAIPVETAIWQLTGRPADIYGIRDRGYLKPGFAADLLLFDPAAVNRGPSYRLFDLPAGAPRLNTDAIGLHGVWVNGVKVADAGGPVAGCGTPGKLLRDFAA